MVVVVFDTCHSPRRQSKTRSQDRQTSMNATWDISSVRTSRSHRRGAKGPCAAGRRTNTTTTDHHPPFPTTSPIQTWVRRYQGRSPLVPWAMPPACSRWWWRMTMVATTATAVPGIRGYAEPGRQREKSPNVRIDERVDRRTSLATVSVNRVGLAAQGWPSSQLGVGRSMGDMDPTFHGIRFGNPPAILKEKSPSPSSSLGPSVPPLALVLSWGYSAPPILRRQMLLIS